MTNARTLLPLATAFAFAVLHTTGAVAEPKVLVSIKPIHSLAAGVMAGVATPGLIVKGARSEHNYALKPSEAKALGQADLIVWVGEMLETFLVKPLSSVKKATHVLELAEVDGLKLLKPREGGVWETHGHAKASHGHGAAGHAHGKPATGHQHDDDEIDGHIWLAPDNARVIVAALVKELSEIDAANRPTYEKNGTALSARIDALDAELKQQLAGIKNQPFIVFHDGYQYLEQHYGLNAVGSITVHPENKPSAKRLTAIRAKLDKLGVRCVFSEPQYNPGLVKTVVEGAKVNVAVLDATGANLPEGPDAYFTLMRNNARSLAGCLGASS